MTYKNVIFFWLGIGLFMLFFQIVIGGVTRLTGSGLSITKWEIVTGAVPPLNRNDWDSEFEKYQKTPQYGKINNGMSLDEFKFIYFWEYLHRLWARSMGLVFLFPFTWFVVKKKLPGSLIKDLGIVIILAICAASFGWLMVASGLINRPWVNAYKLTLHLCIGISVLAYLFWSTLKFVYSRKYNGRPSFVGRKWGSIILTVIIIQLFVGGLMSGMKAALFYPTWPDIGGYFVPGVLLDRSNWTFENITIYDKSDFMLALVQFFHRMIAYSIVLLSSVYFFRIKFCRERSYLSRSYLVFFIVLLLQIVIGIITLISSVGSIPVLLGVIHQGMAVLTLLTFLYHYYFIRSNSIVLKV